MEIVHVAMHSEMTAKACLQRTNKQTRAHLAQEIQGARVVQIHRLAHINQPQLALPRTESITSPLFRSTYQMVIYGVCLAIATACRCLTHVDKHPL